MEKERLYGLLAEFGNSEELLAAAHRTHAAGYRAVDAFSPMPVEGLAEAIGFHKTRLPLVVLLGGILGMLVGYFVQYYANVVSWPINVDGKPHNSWPSFIPITFELTVLFAAIAATLGMLAMNGLPTPYHPLFNVPRFALVTRGRFFLVIKVRDVQFDLAGTRNFLKTLQPDGIYEVPL